ncbi:MAG: NADPH:quinone oxidoreductase family protein [Candidatus Lambdaproteobacteria bacterium]|nr:NADPH:quinone oxidoreductase family protein [Candidatus Lambdaproteobacteria bacterium]
MRAWTVTEYGHYREVLRWGEVETPRPGPGQALVRVAAAGIPFAILLKIAGTYQVKDPLPFIPGMELGGRVVEAGRDCPFTPGQRVVAFIPRGAFAEYAVIGADDGFAAPAQMPDAELPALASIYQTSYLALVDTARLQPGETLLVNGGAGAVGSAAIQIGRALGARVIAAAGSEEKRAVCLAQGAQRAVNYREGSLVEAVREFTEGRGADVIFDPVGGDVFDQSARSLAWKGRLVVIGFADGRIPTLAINRLLLKNAAVMGFFLGSYRAQRSPLVGEARARLLEMYAAGAIRPLVSQRLPMEELPTAIELLETRRSVGKVVVLPSQEA